MIARAAEGLNSSSGAVDLVRLFVWSYLRSNRRFPQTRFYFVVDCCRVAGTRVLSLAPNTGIALSDAIFEALSKAASATHAQTYVPTFVSPERIRADTKKMLLALSDSFGRYRHVMRVGDVEEQFVERCNEFASAIDQSSLSQRYLEFVSPKHCLAHKTEVVRSANIVLESYFFSLAKDDDAFLQALKPEIVRPIWVVRTLPLEYELTH